MRLMTYTPDITVSVTDPIAHAEHCLALAVEAADLAADLRLAEQHSAAGIAREQQRYYLARARAHAEISKAESLRSIADDLNRIGLAQ
jgi:hypothetical protein